MGIGMAMIFIPLQTMAFATIPKEEMGTGKDINEWFGVDKKRKPSWNGGRLVQIEPKCQSFPYCSQGAVDQPIKLIGETKESMCPDCYSVCEMIAKESGKKPEYIAKLIRERYLL